ncbi:hypothetical protein KEM55_006744 [Ascosphaera atra]|nr:hypothetical protein KEM55_006744 [Ascosphaera atra]
MADEGFDDPRRHELIKRIAVHCPLVTTADRAGLWLADLSRLESIASTLESGQKDSPANDRPFGKFRGHTAIMKSMWKETDHCYGTKSVNHPYCTFNACCDKLDIGTRKSDLQYSAMPKTSAAKAAFKRDDGQCRLTRRANAWDIPSYPRLIVPYHIINLNLCEKNANRVPTGDVQSDFWDPLRTYWSADTIARWTQALSWRADGSYDDTCRNILTLSNTPAGFHANALFALKPLDADTESCLTVEFHWLAQHEISDRVDLCAVPSIAQPGETGASGISLWNGQEGRQMVSGDRIMLHTGSPGEWPLPDKGLLEMQWVLQRFAALGGTYWPSSHFRFR